MPLAPECLDCIIIGAGPAGLIAGMYLARFRRQIVLLDEGKSRARYIPVSHNSPGFPAGIAGPDLISRLREQAHQHKVTIITEHVSSLARDGTEFIVEGASGRWRAKTVLLATGVVDQLPSWLGIDPAIRRGLVRLCAVCDAYEVSDQRIAVYGTSATALRHACFLRTFSRQVSVLSADSVTLSANEQKQTDRFCIRVLPTPYTVELLDKVCRITLENQQCDVDTLYVALGVEGSAGLAAAIGACCTEEGELLVDEHMQTSVDGLYAAGDVVSALNQINVAAGQAAIAASAIHHRLPPNVC